MASEIRVDKINSLSGVGTVTLSPTGVDISGITTVSTLKVGTGLTASSDGDVFFTGIATATTFVGNLTGDPTGSGANLTALPAGQLSGALPAISALNLTNVPAANVVGVHTSLNITGSTTTGTAVVGGGVTISESGIDAVGLGITVRNINDSHIGGRRRININGDMMIAQRATSAATQDGTEGYKALDRWNILYSSSAGGAITVSQDTDVPTDYTWGRFNHSSKLDVTTADTSIDDAHAVTYQYRIEAKDIRNSGWNYTSSDSTLSVSFWAKSVKAGTYCVFLFSQDGTQRNNVQEYTLVANTWKHIELEFPGDSAITFDDNTDNGLTVGWALQAGPHRYESVVNGQWLNRSVGNNHGKYATSNQVNFLDSTDNNFYLTGVQIEVGKATRFEHRSYGEELRHCQRYFCRLKPHSGFMNYGMGGAYTNTQAVAEVQLPVPMRSAPTFSYNGALNTYYDIIGAFTSFSAINHTQSMGSSATGYTSVNLQVVGSGTAGNPFMLATYNNTDTYLDFSSEL